MFRYSHVLISDSCAILTFLLGSVLLFGGFVACIAVAALVTQLVLLHPEAALGSFISVLSFSDLELPAPVQVLVTSTNCMGFFGISIFVIRDVVLYIESLQAREVRTAQVSYLPVREVSKGARSQEELRGAVYIQLLDARDDVANW